MTQPLDVLARGGARILGRPLEPIERDNFRKYMNMLIKWQKAQRLVGSANPMWIVEHLFLDSLLFLKLLPPTMRTLLDLGSGAGFPGLPIKIVRAEVDVSLVESRRRRASFLSSVVRELGLGGIHVVAKRLEESDTRLEDRFDAVVMRCAGELNSLLPVAARLATKGGFVIGAGPPTPGSLSMGRWVTVPGWQPGRTRRFAVHQVP